MQSEEQRIGRYRIVRLIRGGGMGKVFLAEDSLIDRQVAIKVIREEVDVQIDPTAANEATRLFLREAKAIARLNHPHILPLFDFGEDQQREMHRVYMVMPYCPDGSLQEWMQQRGSNLPTPQEVSSMVDQAADALQYAHDQHIIHQDVKPRNFLLRKIRHAQVPDLLLADFGVAKVAATTSDVSYAIRGTPAYMAPEQWQGNPVAATDQYGLAATVYQLLTGRQLFQGTQGSIMYQHVMTPPQPPSEFNTQLSPEIDAVLLRALAKKPEERYASITAFALALKKAASKIHTAVPNEKHAHEPLERGETTPEDSSSILSYSTSLQESVPVAEPVPQESVYAHPRSQEHHVRAQRAANQSTFQGPNAVLMPSAAIQASSPIRQRRRASAVMIAFLLVLLIIVIGASAFLAVDIFMNRSNDTNVRATAQANIATGQAQGLTATAGYATATAQAVLNPTQAAQATATASVQGTATAQASATAFAVNPYASGNNMLIFSDLLQNNNQRTWQEYTNNDSACKFVNGTFHAVETHAGYFADCIAVPQFSNFTFEVQMTIIQGDCGGVMFRMDETHQKFYYFRICQHGEYAFYRFVDNTVAHAQKLKEGSSAAFNTGLGQLNAIGMVLANDNLSVYINQNLLLSVTDANYTQGVIALVAGDIADTTDVAFKNVRIWQ